MTDVRRAWSGVWRAFADLPTVLRWSVGTATVLGIAGGLTGLALGLAAYPPTAWFAVLEVGVPAAFLGLFLGAGAGLVALGLERRSTAAGRRAR